MSDPVTVKPAFQSTAPDYGVPGQLGPAEWNAARIFTGGIDGEVCVRDSASITGATWAALTGGGGGSSIASSILEYSFSSNTSAPPTSTQLRINAAHPYTAATALYVRFNTDNGVDAFWILKSWVAGHTITIQDKNDHTMYAQFTVTGAAIDQGNYFEIPVTWLSNGTAFSNNQTVLMQAVAPENAASMPWSAITGTPTTVAGYGITDAVLATDPRLTNARVPLPHTHSAADITSGNLTTGARWPNGTAAAPAVAWAAQPTTGWFFDPVALGTGLPTFVIGTGMSSRWTWGDEFGYNVLRGGSATQLVTQGIRVYGNLAFGPEGTSTSALLMADGGNILAQRQGPNAQTFRIYNTSTDDSNYERGCMAWAGNVLTIAPQAAGSGVLRAMILGSITTVAQLPAATPGARAFVTDATATTFGTVVAGSGSNNVPVYCDGTNWRIG